MSIAGIRDGKETADRGAVRAAPRVAFRNGACRRGAGIEHTTLPPHGSRIPAIDIPILTGQLRSRMIASETQPGLAPPKPEPCVGIVRTVRTTPCSQSRAWHTGTLGQSSQTPKNSHGSVGTPPGMLLRRRVRLVVESRSRMDDFGQQAQPPGCSASVRLEREGECLILE